MPRTPVPERRLPAEENVRRSGPPTFQVTVTTPDEQVQFPLFPCVPVIVAVPSARSTTCPVSFSHLHVHAPAVLPQRPSSARVFWPLSLDAAAFPCLRSDLARSGASSSPPEIDLSVLPMVPPVLPAWAKTEVVSGIENATPTAIAKTGWSTRFRCAVAVRIHIINSQAGILGAGILPHCRTARKRSQRLTPANLRVPRPNDSVGNQPNGPRSPMR